jgi:hypothetical protein
MFSDLNRLDVKEDDRVLILIGADHTASFEISSIEAQSMNSLISLTI